MTLFIILELFRMLDARGVAASPIIRNIKVFRQKLKIKPKLLN